MIYYNNKFFEKLLEYLTKKIWIPIGFLIILLLILYLPSLENGFINGDDNWILTDNSQVRNISVGHIKDLFNNSYKSQYSPINTFLYAIIYHFAGLNSYAFHLFSLLTHILNTLLIFFFIRILNVYLDKNKNFLFAYFTALLFSIHPIQTESVCWISASKVLTYSFFYILSLITYVRYINSEKKIYLVWVFFLFLLSYGCKEQAVILPFSFIGLNIYFGRYSNKKMRKFFLENFFFITLAVALGVFVIRIQSQSNLGLFDQRQDYTIVQRIFFAFYLVSAYIQIHLIPIDLHYSYPFPMNIGEKIPYPYYFYSLISVGIIGFLFWIYKKKHLNKIFLFGFFFFIINICLTLHIIPIARTSILSHRYAYMASVGIFLMLNYIIFHFASKLEYQARCILLFFFYIICLCFYTKNLSMKWTNFDFYISKPEIDIKNN